MNVLMFMLQIMAGMIVHVISLLKVLIGLLALDMILRHTNLKTWLQLLVQGGKRVVLKFDKTLLGLVDNRTKDAISQ